MIWLAIVGALLVLVIAEFLVITEAYRRGQKEGKK